MMRCSTSASRQENHRVPRVRRQWQIACLGQRQPRVFLRCQSSTLNITGVASYEVFLRGTFDKVSTSRRLREDWRIQDGAEPVHRAPDGAQRHDQEMATSLNHNRVASARARDCHRTQEQSEPAVRDLIDRELAPGRCVATRTRRRSCVRGPAGRPGTRDAPRCRRLRPGTTHKRMTDAALSR